MMGRLSGKVALITGAAAGIGRACAAAFVREGAAVALQDVDGAAGETAAQELAAEGGQVVFFPGDVSRPDDVERAVDGAISRFGGLDILVSNAGIGGRSLGDGPVHLCTLEAWEQVLRVNLRGTFLACKYALPALIGRGGGSIITVSSVLGLVGTPGLFDTHAYATSKAGIIGLTRAMAAHYARDHVRANVIAPGLIDTRMAGRAKADPALLDEVGRWQPLGALGEVRDVAAAAVFLASDESRFITGIILPVDGGWTAQ